MKKEAYLVLDIGTGNVRSAIVSPQGELLGVARDDIRYYREELFPESIYFKPDELWKQLTDLTKAALLQAGAVNILAATTTSQREGIVLIDKKQNALIGLPNIDHRGREWEEAYPQKSRIYELSGRFPSSLFSAFKLIATRERQPELWQQVSGFLSISDWAATELSGVSVYEHSQASETLLYDVEAGRWSEELCNMFEMPKELLPDLVQSGSVIGEVKRDIAASLGLNTGIQVVAGGGDTQMAIKSSNPSVGDVVIVSGTTTPVVKLEPSFVKDPQQRTWTSRDIEPGRFVFEANAGVTGLNYQRLKEVFYPNEGYEVIERELKANSYYSCSASLGSLIAGEKKPVIQGGFLFPVPVSHELTRSSLVWATLLDISFSIAANYNVLANISVHAATHIWACGGGMQSEVLRTMIAAITGRQIWVRDGFQQASVIGAAILCNEALELSSQLKHTEIDKTVPDASEAEKYLAYFEQWKQTREHFRVGSH